MKIFLENIDLFFLNSYFFNAPNKLQKDAALDTLGKTAAPNACIHTLGKIAGNDVIVTKTCVMFLRDVLRTQQVNNKSSACFNR